MTPPPIKPPRQDDTPTRLRTNADRDLLKPRTPPRGAPVLAPYVDEDVTGKYEGEALRQARAQRPTGMRVSILERKSDEDRAAQAEFRVEVTQELGNVKTAIAEANVTLKTISKALDRDGDDKADARKSGRALRNVVIGAVLSGGFIADVLHRIGVL